MYSPVYEADDVLVAVGPLMSHGRVISTNEGIQKKGAERLRKRKDEFGHLGVGINNR